MLKRFFFAALLVSATSAHAADWEGIYEGTLGKAKVIVQLVEPLDDMEGETKRETSRYSYLPKVRDLNLMLTGSDKALVFDETPQQVYEFSSAAEGEKKITGHWTLNALAGGAKGTWASPDGKKKLPIVLTRVENMPEEEADPDINIMSATYNELWLKEVGFADAGVAKTLGEVEVRFVKDSAFGITYPVLGAFPDEARKAKVNELLMAAHRRSVAQYRDCKNGVPVAWEEENPEPEMSNEVSYATATLLSFTESGSVFCGGAHPANYATPITYDLVAPAQMGGKYLLDLSPQGFGRVLKLANKDERIAFERFAIGRWKDAAAQDKEMGADCSGSWMEESPEGERDFKLSFQEKGLAVTRTDFPHVASACLFTDFNPTVIPWADLAPWLKEGQNLLTTEIK